MFKINTSVESIEKNKSGNITGIINVSVNGFFFPEVNWNDFVIIVLSWWLEGANRILTHASTEETFKFMDGPLEFKVRRKKNDLEIRFFHKNSLQNNISVNCKLFLDEIVQSAQKIIDKCKYENWESKEISDLKGLLSSINRGEIL